MKNTISPELLEFIGKVQSTMRDLYNEYNSFDEELFYECPLSRFIDDGYSISCMKAEQVIDENV